MTLYCTSLFASVVVLLVLTTSTRALPQGHAFAETIQRPQISPDLVTSDSITSNIFHLNRHTIQLTDQQKKRYNKRTSPSASTTPLTSVQSGNAYLTNITIGSQTFPVIIDTGSSDTWIVSKNFTCYDTDTLQPTSSKSCHFSPSKLDTSHSKTFSHIPHRNFNITYGYGEFLTGYFGNDSVTLAGVTARATIAVVDRAGFHGDDHSSGLLGLAYPDETSMYVGDKLEEDNGCNLIPYDPVFWSMWRHGAVKRGMFSLGLTQKGGVLALGGLPASSDVIKYDGKSMAKVPINILPPRMKPKKCPAPIPEVYQSYNISVKITYSKPVTKQSSTSSTSLPAGTITRSNTFNVIIDSGLSIIYLPRTHADNINKLYNPPAIYSDDYGLPITKCTAKLPENVAFEIGGKLFPLKKEDLLVKNDDDKSGKTCYTPFLGTDEGFMLGDSFLRSVLAVFDVEGGEMRFYKQL